MKSTSPKLFSVIKGCLLVLLLAFWIPFFLPAGIYSNEPFDLVSKAVSKDLDSSSYVLQDDQALRRYLGLDASSFSGISFYRIGDAMSARELVVASSDSADVLDTLEEAVNTRIASQTAVYEGYAPDQSALMQQALVDRQENFLLYYVGDDPNGLDAAFISALKGE